MNSKKTLLAALLAALMLTSGCGSSASQQQTDTAAQTGETGTSNVASASDMAEVEEVVEEGMTPISGDKVKDGTYNVTVKSSSKMFDITACELTVESGKMTATMHMGGKGYLYVYMGTGEQAAAADEADYIPFTEQADGTHSFTVPVDALDEGIDCAAFSKKKEKWYDRTILFRADSLPMDAFADGVVTTPDSLSLADGSYTADVALAGGSGRASVQSPAELTVKDGKVTAKIVWSSKNYDYMKVGDTKYDAVIEDEHSTFEIPVSCFDWAMAVKADTTAMSEAHEIDYSRCVACMDCIGKCRQHAIAFSRNPAAKPASETSASAAAEAPAKTDRVVAAESSSKAERVVAADRPADPSRRKFLTIAGVLAYTATVKAQEKKVDGGLRIRKSRTAPCRSRLRDRWRPAT